MSNGTWKSFGVTGEKMQVNVVEWEDSPTTVSLTLPFRDKTVLAEMTVEQFNALKELLNVVKL